MQPDWSLKSAPRFKRIQLYTLLDDYWRRVKPLFALSLLVLSYSVLRLKLNREFGGATWDQLLSFSAPLPFGHRVLAPIIARAIVEATGLPVKHVFALTEFGSSLGLVLILRKIFRGEMPERMAVSISVGFLFLLPFLFLLQTEWPIFYPYDSVSMMLMVLGLRFLLDDRTIASVLVMFFAALNRETALVLVPLYLALRLGRQATWKVLATAGALLASFVVARAGIREIFPHNLGRPIHWTLGDSPRVLSNLKWLAIPSNAAVLLAYLGFIPLGVWLLKKEIPEVHKRVPLVLFASFLSLLLVGNVYEPRIFGELLAIGFVPVALGFQRWLTADRTPRPAPDIHLRKTLAFVDRWGMLTMLGLWMFVVAMLVRGHIKIE